MEINNIQSTSEISFKEHAKFDGNLVLIKTMKELVMIITILNEDYSRKQNFTNDQKMPLQHKATDAELPWTSCWYDTLESEVIHVFHEWWLCSPDLFNSWFSH